MSQAAVDLSVEIAGLRLPNPLVLASGILGTHASLMVRCARAGAGAITAKSAGPVPRGGHVNPSCVDFGGGLLNAIGLANPGAEAEVALLAETRAQLAELGVPLIASIFADTVDNFARVAEHISRAAPDLIEVNISCPNVGSEFGEPFAGQPESAAAVTAAVKAATGIPVIVKLAPNVPSIARIARAVVEAGADALCAINTMPGMLIDAESGLPVLQNRSGGLSGPALKPIALNAVYQIARVVQVPIIGTGGVSTGQDAIEMLSAGASAVGIGSAVYADGPDAFGRIAREMREWLVAHGLTLAQVRGRAHRQAKWPEAATPAPVPHAPAAETAPPATPRAGAAS
ncbi:MAG: dihydroorotate dehydrogenase [Caldilineae bacterium]|nr:dihydroorotate dehydrogenase [Chloroflexota bacterium]MCB9176921.1 dihydroorotate dehydrogenase [Caldilineae bacterium]